MATVFVLLFEMAMGLGGSCVYKILLVEDDASYRSTLKTIFENEGYEIDAVDNPISGIEFFANNRYDLVISDLKMELMNGVRFLTSIKNMDENIKTMIITACPDDETELMAVDQNVDKYISKDKSLVVILRHVQQLLGEYGSKTNKGDMKITSKSENIVIDLLSHEVRKNEEVVQLTPKEFMLLLLFLRNSGTVLSRDKIISEVWGTPLEEIDERVVDAHVKKLRAKLSTFSIVSIRGYGYKWNE